MLRRDFIKGLFIASTAIVIPTKFNIVAANDLDLYKVDVTFFGIDGTVSKIVLNDTNDRQGILRDHIAKTLDFMNSLSFEPNDNFKRLKLVEDQASRLTPLKESRSIYHYKTICDERNNTEDMFQRNAINLDTFIQPIRLTGHYGIRFGYDPELS